MAETYLIVGLGNPGKKYENTRHNVGFMVVEELAKRWGWADGGRKERKAQVVDGIVKGKKVILAKPQTYMNLSGESVRALMDFYKIEINNLLVIHDDLDTPFGKMRLRKTGGHGGQNGVRNIIQHLGTRDFARVRFGIGRPPGKMDAVRYVLMPFSGDDKIMAQEVVDRSADTAELWLSEGVELAMSRQNGNGAKQNNAPKTDPKEELALYERAHELAPNDPKPLEKMIGVLKRLGKLDKAAVRHLQLAEIYDREGKAGKATTHRERAASLQPELIEVHHQIAEAYLDMNRPKKAVSRYLILASYYEGQREIDKAQQAVQQALEINPQHPKALDMQASLREREAL